MLLSGWQLAFALVVLTAWLALLIVVGWKRLRLSNPPEQSTIRYGLTTAGMWFGAVAVGSLLLLHLSWISPNLSQRLGTGPIRADALFLFWGSLAAFLLSMAGSGRARYFVLATSLATGFCWFILAMGSAISMAAPTARHPMRYLIPSGYVGWVAVQYGEITAPALPLENGTFVCRFVSTGLVETSTTLEEGWAKDEYFYYSDDGTRRELKDTGWGLGGMIWAPSIEWQGSPRKRVTGYFYVGTEEQYLMHAGANAH